MLMASVGGFYVFIGGLAGEKAYKETNPAIWIAILLLGTHCQVGFAVLIRCSACAVFYRIFPHSVPSIKTEGNLTAWQL